VKDTTPANVLNVTAHGRQVLLKHVEARANEQRCKILRDCLTPPSFVSSKVPPERHTNPNTPLDADYLLRKMVERPQFAPLPSRPDPVMEGIVRRKRERSSCTGAGGEDGVVVAAASSLLRTQKERQGTLIAAAELMTSAHDDVRRDAACREEDEEIQRLLRVEMAHEALSKVKEQSVRAVYCAQCDRLTYQKLRSCVTKNHVLRVQETTKRFMKCEHCGCKVGFLGSKHPFTQLPRCPKCDQPTMWVESNAAE
jgi:hypothetical protein